MSYPTLEEVKVYLDIDTPVDDALLQKIINWTIGLLEEYLGRELTLADYDHESYMPESTQIQLKNYPVTLINTITVDGTELTDITDYHLQKKYGILHGNFMVDDTVEINYTGGYAVLPPAIEQVFYQVVDDVYQEQKGASSADVKDVTLFDFAKVSYDTANSGSGSSISYSGVDGGAIPSQLEPYIGVLNMYRSNFVVASLDGVG